MMQLHRVGRFHGKMEHLYRQLSDEWHKRLEGWIARAILAHQRLPAVSIVLQPYGRLAHMSMTDVPAPEAIQQQARATDTSCVPNVTPARLKLRWKSEGLTTSIDWLTA